ncbi:MAG: hypothetical protein ACRDOL_40740 [Streptosporangiaceae bacterium]
MPVGNTRARRPGAAAAPQITPYQQCRGLFSAYPEAVSSDGPGAMVLIVPGSPGPRFFVLGRLRGRGYQLFPWDGDGETGIEPGTVSIPQDYAAVLAGGVPVPREGSLYGWADGKSVTALIQMFTQAREDTPVPGFAVMPRAGTPEAQWPPFAAEPVFGAWFWDHRRAGRIISLAQTAARTRKQMYWSGMQIPAGGSGLIAIAARVTGPGRCRLEPGVYAYYQVLRRREPLPSLDVVLADPARLDIGPRFGRGGR